MTIYTEAEFLEMYRYAERELLGRGGFGTVFKVWDKRIHAYVALKLGDLREREGKSVTVLQSEVETVKRIPPHPNLAIYESYFRVKGEMGEREFAVMRFYNDGSLHDVMLANVLVLSEKEEIVRLLAEGLAHLHANSILHRDLKPSNILIARDPDGCYIPLIADFGLGKITSNELSQFSQSFAGGSALYAAPEQLVGQTVSYAADVWSWGVVAYELLVGSHPYAEEAMRSSESTVTAVLAAELAKDYNSSTDRRLQGNRDNIIFKAISSAIKVPVDLRPKDGKSVADQLSNLEDFDYSIDKVQDQRSETIIEESTNQLRAKSDGNLSENVDNSSSGSKHIFSRYFQLILSYKLVFLVAISVFVSGLVWFFKSETYKDVNVLAPLTCVIASQDVQAEIPETNSISSKDNTLFSTISRFGFENDVNISSVKFSTDGRHSNSLVKIEKYELGDLQNLAVSANYIAMTGINPDTEEAVFVLAQKNGKNENHNLISRISISDGAFRYVNVTDDYCAVALAKRSESGILYGDLLVYKRHGKNWQLHSTLDWSCIKDGTTYKIEIENDLLVYSAIEVDAEADSKKGVGSVYCFDLSQDEPQIVGEVISRPISNRAVFGMSVALSSDLMFISDGAKVYMYRYVGSSWVMLDAQVMNPECDYILSIQADKNLLAVGGVGSMYNDYDNSSISIYNVSNYDFREIESVKWGADSDEEGLTFSLSDNNLFHVVNTKDDKSYIMRTSIDCN